MSGLHCWLSTLRGVGRPTAARKTRFRLLASSTGWDWLPTGLLRKVSAMLKHLYAAPEPVIEQVLSGHYADGLGNVKDAPDRVMTFTTAKKALSP